MLHERGEGGRKTIHGGARQEPVAESTTVLLSKLHQWLHCGVCCCWLAYSSFNLSH